MPMLGAYCVVLSAHGVQSVLIVPEARTFPIWQGTHVEIPLARRRSKPAMQLHKPLESTSFSIKNNQVIPKTKKYESNVLN